MSKKPRILVVEDEEALAIGLQHALAKYLYFIHTICCHQFSPCCVTTLFV